MTSGAAIDEAKDVMTLISKQIVNLSAGDRAGLRRIFLTQRHEADGIVIGLLHGAGVSIPIQAEDFAPWRLLTHVAALLSGTGTFGDPSHLRSAQLGNALQGAGYSEIRLLRLTAARGPGLFDQIIRAARSLAQKRRGPINLWTVLDLAGHDPKRLEEARLRVAHEYYAADVRSKGDSK